MNRIFLLLIAFLAVGCKAKPSKREMPIIRCEVVTSKDTLLSEKVRYTALVEPNLTITLEPRINGYLKEKNFKKGNFVKKGQVLYEIDPTQINLLLSEAEATLSAANATLTKAKNDYMRAMPLAKIKAISSSSLDEYKSSYLSALSALSAAEAKVKNAKLNSRYTIIKSPIDGIISESSAEIGDWVGLGTEYSVLNYILQMDSVLVALQIPYSKYLEVLSYDSSAIQTFNNYNFISNATLSLSNGEKFDEVGVYDYTKSAIDGSTGSLSVEVKFANPKRVLKSGQYVTVEADLGQKRGVITIPQQCVSQVQGVNSIYVVDRDSVAHFRKVKLGKTIGDLWVVEDGVEPNELVVYSGQLKIKDGDKVSIK